MSRGDGCDDVGKRDGGVGSVIKDASDGSADVRLRRIREVLVLLWM